MQALLQPSTLRFGAIPFDQVKIADFIPALDKSLEDARKNLELWKKQTGSSFNDVIVKLDELRETVGQVAGVFYNLHSAHCPEELEKIAPEMSQKLTVFGNDVTLDPIVFARIKECWESREKQTLTSEERMILEKTYRGFVRNGANLNAKDKTRLREIDEELSKTTLAFSQNVLKATNQFEKVITDEKLLEGLPASFKEASAEAAEKKGKKGSWLITLDYPMIVPVLTYAKNRELRKEIFMANASKAFGGELDNQQNVMTITKLRHERANLLGYKTHADYVLEERMASTPQKVTAFLKELQEKAKPQAKKEIAQLNALAKEIDGINQIERWDSAYYSEILKQREIGLDEEKLRPFFQLEKVIDGIFAVTGKLYGLQYKEVKDLPTYHEDVKVFEVSDAKKGFMGLFYMDFFPRETKRGGAWMTNLSDQGLIRGEVRRPHVGIVCNFTKPTKTKPSLLTLNEVTTLYHEFGHALHGLLSQCRYTALSGTSVYWDFVELPSQIMENWVQEKECLDLFAHHFETGEKISLELIDQIKKAGNFLEGLATMRQLTFASLDMAWHSTNPSEIKDVVTFEMKATEGTNLLPNVEGTNGSCSFSHIFAGGYSAGYYSYKWAEVLDADAFEFFQEKGIFDPIAAALFREHILEKGGTEHPMELYKKFRGKEPSVDALLKRAGLMA
ncbi:MAG: M3 family metallopeptidase [Bacteriovoracaceae bacterium]|nr:M3 family metallopeptidase [Bacteriovoracaceae bacterium]